MTLTKSESSKSQTQNHIVYKIHMEANSIIMAFKILKNLFPKSTLEQLHATRNHTVVLKMYNNSTEQMGICTVKL